MVSFVAITFVTGSLSSLITKNVSQRDV